MKRRDSGPRSRSSSATEPTDRRSRPKFWADAVETLLAVLDGYQDWRDNLPDGLADSAIAERLDTVLELRELVESRRFCISGWKHSPTCP
jgi:hypothetical protein